MNEQEQIGATQPQASQCSNAACRTVFTSPVQHCLTCGALLKGKLLSERFRVEALLGRGGMGAVYHATDLALERSVAVKVLAPNAGTAGDAPQELRARFFREARLAAQLDHPNIVPVLHFDIDGPLAYLVMPLLAGGTLAKRVRPRNPNDPVIVAGWLHQIAAALDFGHHRPQPIVHRDVKPSNLLFHEDGRLCLADFGIARVAAGAESGEAAHLTRTGMVLGSLSYMAPEQINGRAVPASDQYSTGVLLYEALTGVLPFDASDNYGLIIQHASATPVLPSEQATNLPRGVDAVVLRALAKQPEERFPTVGALAEAFEASLTSASTGRLPMPSQQFATRPIAPRGTLPLQNAQSQYASFPGDMSGEHPTEAATIQRPSAGWAPAGAPPQKPPATPTRRNWWIPALFVGLAVILLCVVGLAGLSALNRANRTQASQTVTAGVQSPTATATPTQAQTYESLLLAAESNTPIYQDALTARGTWTVTAPERFASDGLHLPTHQLVGRFAGDQTLLAINARRTVPLSDIEVQMKYTGGPVNYGFVFPTKDEPYLALVLNTQGGYGVAQLYKESSKNTISDLAADPRMALAAGNLYHLEVLVESNQFVLFLEHQFIAVLPLPAAFPPLAFLGLFTESPKDTQPSDVVFSQLHIYPTSATTS